MINEFSGQSIAKLSVLLGMIFNGFQLSTQHYNITTVDTAVLVANRTGYHVTVPSSAYSLSPVITVTRAASSSNDGTDEAVNLVEAPVELIRPRVVDSEITAKVERKRESGSQIEIGVVTAPRNFRCCKDNGARKLKNDDQLKEDSFKVYNEVRASALRGGRFEVSDNDGDGNYDKDESGDPKMVHDEDDDDEEDDDDDAIVDDDKVRRNLRRKGNHLNSDPKIWDQWGKWSCCSTTCGFGKYTRWRHCLAGSCVSGEKEAQIKACRMKHCS